MHTYVHIYTYKHTHTQAYEHSKYRRRKINKFIERMKIQTKENI